MCTFLSLDTERLYTDASKALCEPYNKTFTLDIKLKLMGKKEQVAGQTLIGKENFTGSNSACGGSKVSWVWSTLLKWFLNNANSNNLNLNINFYSFMQI